MDEAKITRSESLSSLLSLWSLQDCDDDDIKGLQIRGLSSTYRPVSEMPSLNSIQCTECHAFNNGFSNWCVECGKCISINAKSASEIKDTVMHSSLVGIANVEMAHVSRSMKCENVSEWSHNQSQSQTRKTQLKHDFNMIKTNQRMYHSNGFNSEGKRKVSVEENSNETTASISSREHFTPSSLCSRKWSSGFYMWRNKSSLKPNAPPNLINENLESFVGESQLKTIEYNPLIRITIPDVEEAIEYISNNNEHQSCFLDLPNEIILMILSHLSFQDLRACKRVCKRLHQLAFDFKIDSEAVLSGVVIGETLRKCCETHPTSLTLTKCQLQYNQLSVINRSMYALGNSLKRLTLDTCNMGIAGSDTVLLSLSTSCQNLVYIKLEWITINGKLFSDALKRLEKIEELHLIDVSGISLQDRKKVLDIFSQRPSCRLHSLQLKLRPEIAVSSIFNKRNSLPYLKKIIFRQNLTKISSEDIVCLLTGVPNIKSIEIECIEVTEDAIKILSKTSVKHNL